MEPESQSPQPGQPAASEAAANHAGGRRVKRRLMVAVIGLYVLSLAAAGVLVLRRQAADPKAGGDAAKGLLSLTRERETVGWVTIHGPIYSSDSGRPWEKGAGQWVRRIKAMAETKGVKAIVLDINSPGGSVGAVQEVYSHILRLRKETGIPFVALFGDVSASGGYYIGAACDKIVAHPGSLTGSIGVIFSVSNLEGLFKKIGYKIDPIKSGKHKDIGSPARPMTAEERRLLQDLIDDAYGQFVEAVSVGRGLPDAEVRRLADGRIFSGRQALEAKLIDQLGDSTDALELAGKLGGMTGRPKIRRDTERLSDILELLESRFGGPVGSSWFERLKPAAHEGLEYRWTGW